MPFLKPLSIHTSMFHVFSVFHIPDNSNLIISLGKKNKDLAPKPLHMTITRPYTFFSTQEEKLRKQAAHKKRGGGDKNLNTFQKHQQIANVFVSTKYLFVEKKKFQ